MRFGLALGLAMMTLAATLAAQNLPAVSAIIGRAGWIRVLLQQAQGPVTVSIAKPFRVLTGGSPVYSSPGAGSATASLGAGGISVSASGKTVGPFTSVCIEPELPAAGGFFEIPSGRYRGRLVLTAHGSHMMVINEIQLDDYLKGVLPVEIGESAPEALKAAAISARSECVAKLVHPPHQAEGYDLCAGEHCMAYKGMSKEEVHSNVACDMTMGIVLMAGGKVIDAVYHNVCGGVSANAQDVWDGDPEPGVQAVYDRPQGQPATALSGDSALHAFLTSDSSNCFCNPNNPNYPNYAKKYFRWQKTMTADQLESACGVGRVRDIAVIDRKPSGRVRKVQITGDRGSRVIDKELPIRNMFDLWSGLFVMDVQKSASGIESVTFIGGGNGHGAGLCQMGARTMAELGYTYDKILAHYYRGAQLMRVYRRQ